MSEIWRSRRLLGAMIAVLALVAGCAAVGDPIPTVGGTPPKEDTQAGIERWRCGDYINGCGFPATNCVTLTANLHNGTGEVKFGEFVEPTRFEIHGIERRWDWCMDAGGSYQCALVISVGGRGRYYNFRGSDGRAKPADLFKCEKR